MFGLFKSRKSPVRRRLEKVFGVKRTWIEWTIENGRREPTLVVEYEFDLDPASPDHDVDGFQRIAAALSTLEAGEGPPPRVRVIPRLHDG